MLRAVGMGDADWEKPQIGIASSWNEITPCNLSLDRLAKAGLLYQVTERFARIDLHPKAVDNHQMGLAFEELIRRFAELSNETAGEHFTPREVIRLMVALLFIEDDDVLSKPGVVRSIYDPTVGTDAVRRRGIPR